MANFTWSKSRRAYINDITGKTVSADQLLKWATDATDASKARLQKLAEQLNNGEISEREFQIAMHAEIDNGHSALWALAFGGLLAMTAGRWQAVGNIIRRQQGYSLRFSSQRLSGQVSPEQLVNRAGMYGEAIYSTYVNGTVAREKEIAGIRRLIEPSLRRPTLVPAPTKPRGLLDYIAQRATSAAMRREAAAAGSAAYAAAIAAGQTAEEATAAAIAAIDAVLAGQKPAEPPKPPPGPEKPPPPPYRFARRVLDPKAEHCTDCPELAGVYPIESVPPIGASECQVNCRCTIEFIDGTTEAAA